MDVVVAETALLSDDGGSVEGDDVAATEEPNTDRGKQDMDIEDDEGSIEGDDVVDRDSSSVKPAPATVMYGKIKKKCGRKSFVEILKMKKEEALKKTYHKCDYEAAGDSSSVKVPIAPKVYDRRKKKRGRKSFAEIQKMKEEEEALMKTAENGTNEETGRKKKNIADSDRNNVVEEERVKGEKKKPGRKKKSVIDSVENNVAEEVENVNEEKKKPGRKRKEIFSSGEESEAEQKGGNVTKEKKKKKPGRKRKIISNETEEGEDDEAVLDGENGGFVKEDKIEDELVGEKKSESDVLKEEDQTTLSDDNKGYSLRRTTGVKKPKYIEPKVTKLTNRTKVTSHDLFALLYFIL
jgi:hypothetical protein